MQNRSSKMCQTMRIKSQHLPGHVAKLGHHVKKTLKVTQESHCHLESVDTSDESGYVSNDSGEREGPPKKRRKRKPRNVSLMFAVTVKIRAKVSIATHRIYSKG